MTAIFMKVLAKETLNVFDQTCGNVVANEAYMAQGASHRLNRTTECQDQAFGRNIDHASESLIQ